ncbi:MAG: DUF1223 domain-containing protein [Thermoanaerobaculia bacterium]
MALAVLSLAGQGAPALAEAESSRPAVVVELFTSQGCSSCPAADRVLSRLGTETRTDDLTLVPLAFHVDYWNRIGWVDPFSSPRWSARQQRYAGVFGLRSVYTPQIVLDGRTELVGSHESRLRAEIQTAGHRRPVGRLDIVGARLDGAGSELIVDLAAELDEPQAAPGLVANLALFESGLVTRVESGENARRTLENDYVVRLLRPAIVFEAGQTGGHERLRIALDPHWEVDNLGVAAFLQDPRTLVIHTAAVVEIEPRPLVTMTGSNGAP